MSAPPRPSGPPAGARRLVVRDLVLDCPIGVHRHERGGRQRVRVNLELESADPGPPAADRLAEVIDYHALVVALRGLAAAGHVNLVETLAERVAGICLADPRAGRVRVRVEKLDVFDDVESVGVEIERAREAGP